MFGEGIFARCENLMNINFMNSTVISIGEICFVEYKHLKIAVFDRKSMLEDKYFGTNLSFITDFGHNTF